MMGIDPRKVKLVVHPLSTIMQRQSRTQNIEPGDEQNEKGMTVALDNDAKAGHFVIRLFLGVKIAQQLLEMSKVREVDTETVYRGAVLFLIIRGMLTSDQIVELASLYMAGQHLFNDGARAIARELLISQFEQGGDI